MRRILALLKIVLNKLKTMISFSGPIPPEGQMLKNLPGEAYIPYLAKLVNANKTSAYLEIGTNFGDSLSIVSCTSIAIDPDFKLAMDVIGNKDQCMLYQMTSDEYFENHNPTSIFSGPLDVAFLDGMHLYEFALRDFINAEKNCHNNSLIILHDCIPPNFEMTNRDGKPAMLNPAYENYWTGDVWKTMSIITKYRPDLRIYNIDCPPSGLVVITNCDPESTILLDNYEEIVKEFSESNDDIYNLKNYLDSVNLISSQNTSAEEFLHSVC